MVGIRIRPVLREQVAEARDDHGLRLADMQSTTAFCIADDLGADASQQRFPLPRSDRGAVHGGECVLGVLALETEPGDPRL